MTNDEVVHQQLIALLRGGNVHLNFDRPAKGEFADEKEWQKTFYLQACTACIKLF